MDLNYLQQQWILEPQKKVVLIWWEWSLPQEEDLNSTGEKESLETRLQAKYGLTSNLEFPVFCPSS